MNQRQSQALGALLRQKRKELGYSTYQLAKAAHVDQSVVVRFEQGKFAAPRPDKLARFAQLLGLSLADVYARAGYVVPDDLPNFREYLLAKYGDLPKSALDALYRCFEDASAQRAIEIEEVFPNTQELTDDAVGGTFG
jgi:transcriptional regulator with XRE-family HTH domain